MKSPICEMFEIEFPLVAFSHCRDVVVAVSKAGGMGVLGAVGHTPEMLEQDLKWIDEHIDGKPYGVDILVPTTFEGKGSSVSSEDLINMIPQEYRDFRADVLKQHDVDGESLRNPSDSKKVEMDSDSRFGKNLKEKGAKKLLEVAFSHPIKLIANALGVPPHWMLEMGKANNVKVAALLGAKEHAIKQVQAGVVDKNNKLVGMITYDDILTVLKEEAEEDVLRLAGVGDEEITDGILTKTKRRFNWLLLNLFTAFLATYCISLFGATIQQMVVLAFLMPIVASMGGNAGMQTLAVTIRSLATKDLTKNNFSTNVFKEFNIGILNGVIFAIISSIIVQIWFNDYVLSLIISISMIMTMIVAGLFGILIPVTLKKLNIDPAISSSVFVTTITDVIGFVSFLGVGAYFL